MRSGRLFLAGTGDAGEKVVLMAVAIACNGGMFLALEDQAKIAQALASPDAAGPTEKLRAAFKVGNNFALASNQEYHGLAEYLRNEWGYY